MLTRPFNYKKIRFPLTGCLVFSFLFLGCSESKQENHPVSIQWNGRKAEGIIIPREWLPGIPEDSIRQLLHIQLVNSSTPILGEYRIAGDSVVFRPLIAFTHGLKYEVRLRGKLLAALGIPAGDPIDPPEVTAIYPSADTLPLNLLKIYIAFSRPMQEGQSLKNIAVIKNRHDTISSVFLDLEPELWNKERTILTLWLDPGRIKRDLQPNKKIGSPLQAGASYEIVVKQDWPDAEGISPATAYYKNFLVGSRDSLSPDPGSWTIVSPRAGTRDTLKLDLHESLDYMLLKNAVRIVDGKGSIIPGVTVTGKEETTWNFTPLDAWNPDDYTIEIESRLEDLAGNNLNRLFDKDLTRQSTGGQKEIYKRSFHPQ